MLELQGYMALDAVGGPARPQGTPRDETITRVVLLSNNNNDDATGGRQGLEGLQLSGESCRSHLLILREKGLINLHSESARTWNGALRPAMQVFREVASCTVPPHS